MFKNVILYADDDPVSCFIVEKVLEKSGYKIIRAINGLEAIQKFELFENEIDLILMDMQMPVVDGYKATKQIRKKNSAVPIIALTAFALSGDREKCIECGCTDYLSKPFNNDQLIKIVNHHLGKLHA
ncbi:MAG: response regulator [Calditrichaeota bacterium]|nr:MAG: response regulator [Calditrichota bacterium]MBL1207267.1 response regulator [Calditrichota bacterium]NOG47100.1 response regulator [Calditrichota bacterium]